MPDYDLHLASGQTLDGHDDREPEALAVAVSSGLDDFESPGWTWIAGHYVRTNEIRAFTRHTCGSNAAISHERDTP